jgi:RNA polymerase sigma factor (sigma-70 family)
VTRLADPVAIVQRIYLPLLRVAQALADPDDAEDLVQQALTETLRRYPAFDGIEHPLGYTRVIVVRLAAGLSSRRQRERAWIEAAAVLEVSRAGPGEALAPQQFLARLSTLGDKQRACVFLKYFCDLDDRSIASVLGCRPSTVRSQLSRAMNHLRLAEVNAPGGTE